MMRTRIPALFMLLAAGAISLTACGPNSSDKAASSVKGTVDHALQTLSFTAGTAKGNNAPANTGDFFDGPRDSPAALKWVQLSAGAAGNLNPVVLNGKGRTLYRFDKDSASPSKSNCNDSCKQLWPPVLVAPGSRIFVDGVPKNKVGVVKRDDGTLQVTLDGWPMYLYSKDTGPGQTNGQGVGGVWFAFAPDGSKAVQSSQGTDDRTGLDYADGTAAQHHAPSNTGDLYKGKRSDPAALKWIQLTSGSANGLNPIVHDAAGRVLYRFDKDSASPSKSNCDGACEQLWPPLLAHAGTRIFVSGVPKDKVGVVKRDDGTLQITLGGWPVYYFSKDTGPGQTNGEGVGGVWFAVSPVGGKVLPPIESSGTGTTAPTATSSTVVLGNGSVILDSGENFTEPEGSVGEAGPGCRTLSAPFPTLSIQLADGPVKVWSGPGCTGKSQVITGSVPDLSAIGFTQPIASIRFGG